MTEITTEMFLKDLERGRKDFSRENLWALDLSGTDVKLMDLNFSGANLVGANLNGKFVSQCDFIDTNLAAAKLNGAWIFGSMFRNACLVGAKLSRAQIRKVDFTGADLTRARMTRAEFDDVIFSGTVLRGAKLKEATGLVTDLREADLTGAEAEDSEIRVGLDRLPWPGPGALVPAAGNGVRTRDLVAALLWNEIAGLEDRSTALMVVGQYQEVLEDIRASCLSRFAFQGPSEDSRPGDEQPEPEGP